MQPAHPFQNSFTPAHSGAQNIECEYFEEIFGENEDLDEEAVEAEQVRVCEENCDLQKLLKNGDIPLFM